METEELVSEGETEAWRVRERCAKGEPMLGSQPLALSLKPCPPHSPVMASLQAASRRSGVFGGSPDGAGTPSLFLLLKKPGNETCVTSLREDIGELSLADH